MTTTTTTSTTQGPTSNKRGRPRIVSDNRACRAFLSSWETFTDLAADLPALESIFTGATLLREPGQTSTRPLSKGRLFLLLRSLNEISTEGVGSILSGLHLEERTLRLYAGTLRVISKAITHGLQGPHEAAWRAAAQAQQQAAEAVEREFGKPPANGPIWQPTRITTSATAGRSSADASPPLPGLEGVCRDAAQRWKKAGKLARWRAGEAERPRRP